MNAPQVLSLSWLDVLNATRDLINKLPPRRYHYLVAITRGGLIPAGLLAQALNIPLVDTIAVQSRAPDGSPTPPRILLGPRLGTLGPDALVIDDIVDSGATFRLLQSYHPNATYAALYGRGSRSRALIGCTIYGKEWLHFPWEPAPFFPMVNPLATLAPEESAG